MWVMSSLQRERNELRPWSGKSIEFYIGNLRIVSFSFAKAETRQGYKVVAEYADGTRTYDTMSDAMKAMHGRLNGPSPEGAKVSGYEARLRSDPSVAQRPAEEAGSQSGSET